jgi:Carboxypeptidase regulatory-like domain
VLTDKPSTVSGQLVDQKGAPLTDGTVLVFAEDPQRWTDGSRWVASARPDQGGNYQFRGLPPGGYLAIALEYVEDGSWNDPAYLESIRHRADRFVLEEAATDALSLKMVTP